MKKNSLSGMKWYKIEIKEDKIFVSIELTNKKNFTYEIGKFKEIHILNNMNNKVGKGQIRINFIDEVAMILDKERKILEDWFERHK